MRMLIDETRRAVDVVVARETGFFHVKPSDLRSRAFSDLIPIKTADSRTGVHPYARADSQDLLTRSDPGILGADRLCALCAYMGVVTCAFIATSDKSPFVTPSRQRLLSRHDPSCFCCPRFM